MRLKLALALVLLPGLAGAQSLGDAARKEKDRRKRLEESGVKPRELTDKDLRSGKGTLANDPAIACCTSRATAGSWFGSTAGRSSPGRWTPARSPTG